MILMSVDGAVPVEPDFGLRMPGGDFAAVDGRGNDVMLNSHGFMTVEMNSESGERLELLPDVEATLRFSMPWHEQLAAPDSVPLWHFNTETAIWEQDGWSFRNGSTYEGNVRHFSSWNCGVPQERVTVMGRVVDCNGEGLAGAWVRVGQRHLVTDSLGTYRCFVPLNTLFDVWTNNDALRNLSFSTPAFETLQSLTGIVLSGAAYWNPFTKSLFVNLVGDVPAGLRLSIDGGVTWTTDRQFSELFEVPEEVLLDDECGTTIRVLILPKQDDCRMLTLEELEDATLFSSWFQVDMSPDSTVYKLYFMEGFYPNYWERLLALTCLQQIYALGTPEDSIPELIGALVQLQSIFFQDCQISAIPEAFGSLINLKTLFLVQNQISALPSSFSNLTQLMKLELSDNPLDSIPLYIGNFSQLEELSFNNNQLTVVPASLGNLSNLKRLYLEDNQLTEVPASLGNLSQLTSLGLEGNQLTELPSSFANLADSLEFLNLIGSPVPVGSQAAIQAMLPNTTIFWE